MAKVFGEVIPTPGGKLPFKIEFVIEGGSVFSIPVRTEAEGEALIIEMFGNLRDFAKRDGHV